MSLSSLDLFGTIEPDFNLTEVMGARANCGIIVAQDGSWKVFRSGTDNVPSEDAGQVAAMERKVLALAVALSNEQLMAILYDVMDNTEVLNLLKEPAHVE